MPVAAAAEEARLANVNLRHDGIFPAQRPLLPVPEKRRQWRLLYLNAVLAERRELQDAPAPRRRRRRC